jgi:hypothetical protein
VGSRVPIDRIVWEYRNGEDPETVRSHYPTLSLDQVKGAIGFYLKHRVEVEQVISRCLPKPPSWSRQLWCLSSTTMGMSGVG